MDLFQERQIQTVTGRKRETTELEKSGLWGIPTAVAKPPELPGLAAVSECGL